MNSSKCNKQLNNVTELKELLEQSQNYCLNARYALNNTLNKFTYQSLGLIKNEYKKNQLVCLIRSLSKIKSLVSRLTFTKSFSSTNLKFN
jgi:hypothetical protein